MLVANVAAKRGPLVTQIAFAGHRSVLVPSPQRAPGARHAWGTYRSRRSPARGRYHTSTLNSRPCQRKRSGRALLGKLQMTNSDGSSPGLSGAQVRRMIQGAAGWVALHREALNQINVFPVPDGDTGANLGRTLAAASESLDEIAEDAPSHEIAAAAASAALLGGRGSSGVIGAQWLRGFASGLAGNADAGAGSLARAFNAAADAARNAVAEPRDGTMISVAADTAAAVRSAQGDPVSQLRVAVEAANESVEYTPEQNPVLKDAGVVDAGARGLEFMLRGMAGALAGEPIPDVPAELGAIDPGWLARGLDSGGDFDGFCTELVVAGVEDIDGLREILAGDDETVMLAPDGDDLRIHIHTVEPADTYAAADAAGRIRVFRAVDMRAQAARTHESQSDPAVVAVAQGSGFVRVFTELGAAAIVSGGAADNPSVEMLFSAAESVKGRDVIVLPNNHNVTPAAERAGELAAAADEPQRLHVIHNDSQAEGVAALTALIGGVPVDDVVSEMQEAMQSVRIGRVTLAARTLEGDTPIAEGQPFAMLDGEIVGAGSEIDDVARSLAERMAESLSGASLFTLYFGADVSEERAEAMAEQIESQTGIEVDLVAGGQPHYPWLLALE
ncbi:MAG: DAK2 domain-containing protein [Chloroflexi bacterium]|nr:DAK2 domain-containing protein [Chloroflexota bacterium]